MAVTQLRIDDISIHTPREGSDFTVQQKTEYVIVFQSTLPARGVTIIANPWDETKGISIHTPREGSDAALWPIIAIIADFNPHSPRGE